MFAGCGRPSIFLGVWNQGALLGPTAASAPGSVWRYHAQLGSGGGGIRVPEQQLYVCVFPGVC